MISKQQNNKIAILGLIMAVAFTLMQSYSCANTTKSDQSEKNTPLVTNGSAKVKPDPKLISNWSENQGLISFDHEINPIEKCANIGMRLPTIEELKAAYSAGVTKKWETVTPLYYSATFDKHYAYPYMINVSTGKVFFPEDTTSNTNVRCIK